MVRADWAIVTGWQKLLLGVALCLPIPALAASGLELPLPSAVYRVAVALVESTEGLAGALTGGREETSVASARTTTVPISEQPAERSRGSRGVAVRAERGQTPSRVERVAPTRVPAKSSRVAPPVAAKPANAPSAPAARTRAAETTPAPGTVAPAPTPAPSATPELRNERASTESPQRPAETSPIEPPVKPPLSASPPAPPPPPSPPPVVTPLDPVTKPLEPVTKPLEPVTKPLEPVTDVLEPVTKPLGAVTGGLGLP